MEYCGLDSDTKAVAPRSTEQVRLPSKGVLACRHGKEAEAVIRGRTSTPVPRRDACSTRATGVREQVPLVTTRPLPS